MPPTKFNKCIRYRVVGITLIFAISLFWGCQQTMAACAPPAYERVAAEFGLPADVLYAVSLAESGTMLDDYGFQVWPWALNINDQSYYPKTQQEARNLVERELAKGSDRIAVGLMQIYWRFHKNIFRDQPTYALDVGANLRAGAKILRDFLDQSADVWTAVGFYYAGSSQTPRTIKAAKSYRQRVRRLHKQYVLPRCEQTSATS